MNPPFGEASKPSKGYVERTYPRTKIGWLDDGHVHAMDQLKRAAEGIGCSTLAVTVTDVGAIEPGVPCIISLCGQHGGLCHFVVVVHHVSGSMPESPTLLPCGRQSGYCFVHRIV